MTSLIRNRLMRLEGRRLSETRFVVRKQHGESTAAALRRTGIMGRVAVLPEPVADVAQWLSIYGPR